jgi:hypothetical protein
MAKPLGQHLRHRPGIGAVGRQLTKKSAGIIFGPEALKNLTQSRTSGLDDCRHDPPHWPARLKPQAWDALIAEICAIPARTAERLVLAEKHFILHDPNYAADSSCRTSSCL